MNFINKKNPIGVFDSGIGGLTVVKRIRQYLPSENIIYFGDTARVPYGNKSNATVTEYAKEITEFLLRKNVKLIVVACNTVSSVAIDFLKSHYDVPIIGMIEPGAKMAADYAANKKVGVIGTYATINNHAYKKKLKELSNEFEVFEKACPLFVPLAEEGMTNHPATKLIAEEYLSELKEKKLDALILGCTHYPILISPIREAIGEGIKLIDSGVAAAIEVEKHLAGRGVLNDSNNLGSLEFYVSDIQTKFKEVAGLFLGSSIENLNRVSPEELVLKK